MEYTEDQLTGWFVRDVDALPAVDGVYQIEDAYGAQVFSYFCGDRFYLQALSPNVAEANAIADIPISCYWKKWRGLNHNPAKPSPKRNKRKTMWLVIDPDWSFGKREVACFDTRREADAFIKHRNKKQSFSRLRAEPLRFRIP